MAKRNTPWWVHDELPPARLLSLRSSGTARLIEAGDAVRIDRQTRWGNPFRMNGESERASVILAYRGWLWTQVREGRIGLEQLAGLAGKSLACWCAPKPCHGQVLAAAAQWAKAELRLRAEGPERRMGWC